MGGMNYNSRTQASHWIKKDKVHEVMSGSEKNGRSMMSR